MGRQEMKRRNLFESVSLVVALGSCLYAGIGIRGRAIEDIWIDAGRPLEVKAPFDIVEIGKKGERGLWIGPEIGRGWKGEAGGEATYGFYVDSDGEYWLWAYCLWHDECTDAVYAEIDDMKRAIVGNDPIYGRWHWVKAFSIDLKRGKHLLRLSNHSDNIAVLKLFLTSSPSARPEESEPAFTDLFYEGFDGCDDGNFALWEMYGGSWVVSRSLDQQDTLKKELVGTSQGKALLAYRMELPGAYVINASVLSAGTGDSSETGFCFGLAGEADYHQLRWTGIPEGKKADMRIVRALDGATDTLARFQVPWKSGVWHEIEIRVEQGRVTIAVDGGKETAVPMAGGTHGGIGLWLSGQVTARFDNIRVRSVQGRGR